MFLTEFRVGGFKAFRDTQRLPIKPITLVFGPNSGGKSSLIHALLFAHEAIVNEKLDVRQTQLGGDSVDLGGFANYAYGHELAREIEFGFRLPKPVLSDGSCPVADSEFNITSRVACSHVPHVRTCSIASRHFRMLLTESAGKLSLVEIDGEPIGSYRVYKTREMHSDEQEIEAPDFRPGNAQWGGGPTYDEWTQVREVEAVGAGLVPRCLAGRQEEGEPQLKGSWDNHRRIAVPWLGAEQLPGYLSYEEWARRNRVDLPRYAQAAEITLDEEAGPSEGDRTDKPTEGGNAQYAAFIQRLRDSHKTVPKRAIPFEAELNDIVKTVHSRLCGGFGKLKYLGPFRSYPSRRLPLPAANNPNFNATGASAWYKVQTDDDVRTAVNHWLGSGLLQTPYEIEPGGPETTELRLTDVRRKVRVSHRDIGIGVSQVLPVLVEAYGSSGATIVIEQPEIHLHPALQAELGDVFIKAALSERQNTFIIETHSEHLILRLLRRIRETSEGNIASGLTAVTPEHVSVVYVEPTESGSRVLVMNVDEKGRLATPWPGGFFTERADELF